MKSTSAIFLSVAIVGLLSCSEKERKETITTAPFNSATTTQGATAALNPAHGQPNHRCDIPEGAPLDAPAQPNLNAPQPLTPPVQVPQGAVAAGTNPPHGQPGHDCAIAVGAPLNK